MNYNIQQYDNIINDLIRELKTLNDNIHTAVISTNVLNKYMKYRVLMSRTSNKYKLYSALVQQLELISNIIIYRDEITKHPDFLTNTAKQSETDINTLMVYLNINLNDYANQSKQKINNNIYISDVLSYFVKLRNDFRTSQVQPFQQNISSNQSIQQAVDINDLVIEYNTNISNLRKYLEQLSNDIKNIYIYTNEYDTYNNINNNIQLKYNQISQNTIHNNIRKLYLNNKNLYKKMLTQLQLVYAIIEYNKAIHDYKKNENKTPINNIEVKINNLMTQLNITLNSKQELNIYIYNALRYFAEIKNNFKNPQIQSSQQNIPLIQPNQPIKNNALEQFNNLIEQYKNIITRLEMLLTNANKYITKLQIDETKHNEFKQYEDNIIAQIDNINKKQVKNYNITYNFYKNKYNKLLIQLEVIYKIIAYRDLITQSKQNTHNKIQEQFDEINKLLSLLKISLDEIIYNKIPKNNIYIIDALKYYNTLREQYIKIQSTHSTQSKSQNNTLHKNELIIIYTNNINELKEELITLDNNIDKVFSHSNNYDKFHNTKQNIEKEYNKIQNKTLQHDFNEKKKECENLLKQLELIYKIIDYHKAIIKKNKKQTMQLSTDIIQLINNLKLTLSDYFNITKKINNPNIFINNALYLYVSLSDKHKNITSQPNVPSLSHQLSLSTQSSVPIGEPIIEQTTTPYRKSPPISQRISFSSSPINNDIDYYYGDSNSIFIDINDVNISLEEKIQRDIKYLSDLVNSIQIESLFSTSDIYIYTYIYDTYINNKSVQSNNAITNYIDKIQHDNVLGILGDLLNENNKIITVLHTKIKQEFKPLLDEIYKVLKKCYDIIFKKQHAFTDNEVLIFINHENNRQIYDIFDTVIMPILQKITGIMLNIPINNDTLTGGTKIGILHELYNSINDVNRDLIHNILEYTSIIPDKNIENLISERIEHYKQIFKNNNTIGNIIKRQGIISIAKQNYVKYVATVLNKLNKRLNTQNFYKFIPKRLSDFTDNILNKILNNPIIEMQVKEQILAQMKKIQTKIEYYKQATLIRKNNNNENNENSINKDIETMFTQNII